MDYKKYFIVPAEPEEIYAALTFRPSLELWTGSPAVFEKKEGNEGGELVLIKLSATHLNYKELKRVKCAQGVTPQEQEGRRKRQSRICTP